MVIRFMMQVVVFGFAYLLVMMVAFPFLIYFGKPKPWQKGVQFLMSFPVDNEKVGAFSFFGGVAVFFLNGLLWGLLAVSLFRAGTLLKNLIHP